MIRHMSEKAADVWTKLNDPLSIVPPQAPCHKRRHLLILSATDIGDGRSRRYALDYSGEAEQSLVLRSGRALMLSALQDVSASSNVDRISPP